MVWNIFHPNWLIFFRGVETTNQYSCRFYHTVDYLNLNYIELHPCQKWLCLQIGDPHNLGVSSKLPLAQQVRVSHGIHHFNTQAKFHVGAYITALHYMIYIVLKQIPLYPIISPLYPIMCWFYIPWYGLSIISIYIMCFSVCFITSQSYSHYISIYWLVVWNMNFIFPYIGNSNNTNWRTIFFKRGDSTTNQYIYIYKFHKTTLLELVPG